MIWWGLAGLGAFFALNMGGSGLVPSFSVAIGARLISWKWAVALFAVLAFVGAVSFGHSVVKTLGNGLVPGNSLNATIVLIVLFSTTCCLFLANALKLPESTSWVTVASLSTVGLYLDNLKTDTLFWRLLPAWVILPCVAFGMTWWILRFFYPLEKKNFRFYEQMVKHESKMRRFVLLSSCCVAVAIGSNNVANVVGPLAAIGFLEPSQGLLWFAPIFGLGALVFRGSLQSVGKDLVPLGLFTASLIKFVFGGLLLSASLLGIPQSSVQLSFACVLAVGITKEGAGEMWKNKSLRKIVVLWFCNPLIASGITWGLLSVFVR